MITTVVDERVKLDEAQ